jgi:hypothetical protein
MHELYWGIEEDAGFSMAHTSTAGANGPTPAEHVTPATMAILDAKRAAKDYAGWASTVNASPAQPWWARTIVAMMNAGSIALPVQAAKAWCDARDRFV